MDENDEKIAAETEIAEGIRPWKDLRQDDEMRNRRRVERRANIEEKKNNLEIRKEEEGEE